MKQSRTDSAIEVATNTAVGMAGSFFITYGVMAWTSLDTGAKSGLIVGLCTAWSLIRGYWMRRHFENATSRRRSAGVEPDRPWPRYAGYNGPAPAARPPIPPPPPGRP